MNRGELVAAVTEATSLPRAQVDATLSAVLEQIVGATAAGEKVTLLGFGTFEARERAAREGRNPGTGQVLQIGATRSVGFKVGGRLQAAGRCFHARSKEEWARGCEGRAGGGETSGTSRKGGRQDGVQEAARQEVAPGRQRRHLSQFTLSHSRVGLRDGAAKARFGRRKIPAAGPSVQPSGRRELGVEANGWLRRSARSSTVGADDLQAVVDGPVDELPCFMTVGPNELESDQDPRSRVRGRDSLWLAELADLLDLRNPERDCPGQRSSTGNAGMSSR